MRSESIRCGDKLSLGVAARGPVLPPRRVHRLPGDQRAVERRLAGERHGTRPRSRVAVSAVAQGQLGQDVFLGCAPPRPGLVVDESTTARRSPTCTAGLPRLRGGLAPESRPKIDDPRVPARAPTLAHTATPARAGPRCSPATSATSCWSSAACLHYRIVLTCERGCSRFDISHLPDLVIRGPAGARWRSGSASSGRIRHGAFAVFGRHDRAVGPHQSLGPATPVARRSPACSSCAHAARHAGRVWNPGRTRS